MRTIEEIRLEEMRAELLQYKKYEDVPKELRTEYNKISLQITQQKEADIYNREQATKGITLNRLQEICNAERDGRLVVLPCKVGRDIYWINEENEVKCHKNGVRGIVIRKDKILIEDTDGCIDEIGTKYCYLSREQAEQALKGGAAK